MVMQTKTAGPGQFAAFDLASVPSPCFVTDLARLEDNLAVLKEVADQSGAQILTALKAFPSGQLPLWSAAIYPGPVPLGCMKRAWPAAIM